MSDTSTVQMLERFRQEAGSPLFLASYFKTGPRDIHNTEKVSVDVEREDEDIAVPVQDISAEYRNNERTKYVNKEFTPPILKEKASIIGWEQFKRQPGVNPFENPDFARSAGDQAFALVRVLGNKMRRTIELMASQVFQTGIISLVDSAGVVIYTLDFGMRSAHKVTTTAWAADGSTGTPLADITSLAHTIRRNGKKRPDRLLFGLGAAQRFLANARVQAQLDKTKINLGALNPANRNEDATYWGMIWIDNYQYELWFYDGHYKHPQTGAMTTYISDNKVLLLSSKARYNLSFGSIPRMAPQGAQAAAFLPSRLTATDLGIDIEPYAYFTPDGEQLVLNMGNRPLSIPTELDAHGCLTTF